MENSSRNKPGLELRSFLASIICFLFVNFGCEFRTEEKYAETQRAEKKEVELPDESLVILNADSELGWSPGGWLKSKHVTLKGEAYFKIKKGKKLTVKTKLGNIEIKGTIFNVYVRGEVLEVQCLEGKVQVNNTKGKQKILLKKGEEVAVVGGWMQDRMKLRYYPVWFKGESTFRDAPLNRVFEEIERQYNVYVIADSIVTLTFSGKFTHKDLQQALLPVCRQNKLRYVIQSDSVVISGIK
jgi:ferric-dicitrate binding protein FerR (iron transport regulator)